MEKSIRASLCLHVRDAQKTVQPAETDPPASPIHDERKTFRMPHAVNGSPFWAAHGQSACTFLRRAEVGPSEGSGFRGVSFHFIVQSREAVDEVMGNAVAAGGGVVKEAAVAPWGYFGYFSDPDGYLWKVASAS